jgi:hypothetical protein
MLKVRHVADTGDLPLSPGLAELLSLMHFLMPEKCK